MQKLKIVVLEKNDDNQNGVSNYLKNCEEINLIGAYSNDVSLYNTLKVTQLDVLIVDMFLDGVDGINVIENIRRGSEYYHVPKHIIVMTQFMSNFINNKLNQLNVDYVTMKPVNNKQLTQTSKMLVQIGDYSFGIYISHIMIMILLGKIPIYTKIPFCLNSIIVLLITTLCVFIGNTICGKKISKWLGLY